MFSSVSRVDAVQRVEQGVFTPVAKTQANLRLHQVSQAFENLANPAEPIRILTDINLNIQVGETLALSGPSGCGKSTLLQIISGNLTPSNGEVWWGDQRLDQFKEADRAAWRLQNIGLIFQDFRLFSHLTALENVALPLELLGYSSRQACDQAIPLLEQVGLKSRSSHKPHILSGGEKQRVALARALVTRPLLLIADEPTGNLDQETAAVVEDLLLSQVSQRQVGLVYVTHDLRFAARADTHWGLHEGQILKRTTLSAPRD